MKEKIIDFISPFKEGLIAYGGKLVLAIVLLIVGFWIIKKITKIVKKILEKRNVDPTLLPFFIGILNYTLKILLIISIMSMVGIAMTSFIAILGAAGLAIGMALSGTLQNFAAGVMILLLKPFRNGDFIDAAGYKGVVDEVQIFNTILKTTDNRIVIIPNALLSNASLVNFSREDTRRVDFSFGIGYGDDIEKAKKIILDVVAKHGKALDTPAPFVAIGNLGDSSVDITTRVWVNAPDYWDFFFYMNETVKKEFDKNGISIPFPQRDIHLIKEE